MNFRNKKDSVCTNNDVKKLRIAIPGKGFRQSLFTLFPKLQLGKDTPEAPPSTCSGQELSVTDTTSAHSQSTPTCSFTLPRLSGS